MSDYVAQVYPDPVDINHGDAVHYDPDKAVVGAGLGYIGSEPDTLDSRLQFFDGIFAGAGFPGKVPDPLVEADKFLKDDGTWDTPTAVVDVTDDYAWTGAHTFDDVSYTDTYWDDLRIPMSATKKGAAKEPEWRILTDALYTYQFKKSEEQELFFTVQLPHSWKEGTDIRPHVHWAPMDTDTGKVVWFLEYTWQNIDGGAFPASTPISMADAGDGTALGHQITYLPAIDGSGKTMSSMLACRISRDGGEGVDDYDEWAALLEVDFHYEVDRPGSRLELTK